MSDVVKLPVVRIERFGDGGAVLVRLPQRDWSRLVKRAKEWNMEPNEAAADIIAGALSPARRR